jgi:hypothetical protein
MIEDRTQSRAFGAIANELVAAGLNFRFQARGRSMLPAIRDGEILHVQPVDTATIRVADLVLFKDGAGFKAHRVVRTQGGVFVTRGDAGLESDNAIRGSQIMGKIIAKECAETGRMMALDGFVPRMKFFASEGKRFISRQIRRRGPDAHSALLIAALALAILISPNDATAQQTIGGVALDNANSQAFTVGSNGSTCAAGTGTTWNCSFTHTTNSVALSASTGLLLVGFSINTQGNGSDSQVTAVTYNGTSMGSPSVNYSPGNNFRLQIYYLKSIGLTTGTHTVAFTVNKTGGQGNPLGVVAGAITLYQVNQTFGAIYPITATNFGTSATASVSFSGTNKPANNDGVIDVLAVIQGTTVTPNSNTTPPLVFENQLWSTQSGTSGQDVTGESSSAGGIGATLTMQEGLSSSTAWAIAAIAVPASHPTVAKTDSFSASQTSSGTLLSWHTSGELHNLGFNIYREIGGEKVNVNPSLIAGSALLMREALEQHGARTYGWMDRAPAGGGLYWLEDVDLNGTRTMHGPVSVASGTNPSLAVARAITMQDLAHATSTRAAANPSFAPAHVRETVAKPRFSATTREIGFHLASQPAVKILADHEGWYRVTQPQLVAAGFSSNTEARSLHLFAEGVEQPIRITGASSRFGPQAAIEFYGTAIDTPYSGQRVYWLVASNQPGKRISTESATGSDGPLAQSFIQTVELKPRTTYFAALLHENTDNFFGPLVSPEPAIQTLNVSNLVNGDGTIEVALQGVTLGQQHNVTVMLNGATLGNVNFADQQEGKARFSIPSGVLLNGQNTITLTAQLGDNDLSVVDYINVSFPHSFTAESDSLKFTANSGETVKVGGFVHAPLRLIDITNPAQPFVIASRTTSWNGTYTLESNIPWTSAGRHTLLALSDAVFATPAALTFHHPSDLHSPQVGAEAVMLTAPQFADQIRPLAELRRSEGKSVTVVNVNDVYDEFNFGEPTPYAIRAFLRTATRTWHTAPHYLLLAGDASVDPRNYLGFGFFDFVPTKIVITSALKTASDDWFSDFENTGFAKIATGRLPARTASDMQTMVNKIMGYTSAPGGTWTNQSMLVADVDDSVSFTQAAISVQKMLPATIHVTDVFASTLGASTARQNLLAGINAGQLLVNYNGHGSVEIWGSGLFDDTVAASLTNDNKLPMFVAMNCLNGFFHDVYTESLATALMLAPNGGAVSVWASSGLTEASSQFQMDQALMQGLFSQPSTTVGDAVLFAKSGIADADTRKTFILFGDPMMRLKTAGSLQPVLPGPPLGLPVKDVGTISRRFFNEY